MFTKYQHVERFGTDEVEGIELGTCLVFPKIDGSNGSVWLDTIDTFSGISTVVSAGSRNRTLTLTADNLGFYAYILKQENIKSFLQEYPNYILYGEWLKPHSLKTYREDAWNKFYVFDVCYYGDDNELKYTPYNDYKDELEKYKIDYIPCIAEVTNGSYEQYINILKQNNYLIKDGEGSGEGLVIKRYDYKNKYGRTTWAKIVTAEFKEKHFKEMGCPKVLGESIIEQEIITEFCTETFIQKTFEKVKAKNNGWSSKYIPELLGTIWHDFIDEEMFHIIKKHKNPNIDFKRLMQFLNIKVKEILKEIF
jgi:ATP-dependent RNA circularization protein (DNA/RNA ligase family)